MLVEKAVLIFEKLRHSSWYAWKIDDFLFVPHQTAQILIFVQLASINIK